MRLDLVVTRNCWQGMVAKARLDVAVVAAHHMVHEHKEMARAGLVAIGSKAQQQGDEETQEEHGSLRHSQRRGPARFHWKHTTTETDQNKRKREQQRRKRLQKEEKRKVVSGEGVRGVDLGEGDQGSGFRRRRTKERV